LILLDLVVHPDHQVQQFASFHLTFLAPVIVRIELFPWLLEVAILHPNSLLLAEVFLRCSEFAMDSIPRNLQTLSLVTGYLAFFPPPVPAHLGTQYLCLMRIALHLSRVAHPRLVLESQLLHTLLANPDRNEFLPPFVTHCVEFKKRELLGYLAETGLLSLSLGAGGH
jgi:hypothetical protein